MNYSKISGQLVCKMAMMFAFMFAACSETDSGRNLAGGTVEETGVYALIGHAGDVVPKVMKMEGHNSMSEGVDGYLNSPRGTVVNIYELDSLTLEPTGRAFADTIDNDEGRFALVDAFLESPYVLIEIRKYCDISGECRESSLLDSDLRLVPLTAIVDVRKNRDISVNTLTYEKTPLLKKYFAEGMSFDTAGKKAEQEILEKFGVYEDLGDFENPVSVKGELSYLIKMVSVVSRMGVLYDAILPINIEYYYGVLPSAVAALGPAAEERYSNTIKLLEYEIAYFAYKMGWGRCDESRENEIHNLIEGSYIGYESVVCHSNKWVPGWKRVEYTNGTMVDNRDGKTYKTVTYNWGGVTQTWMAENLNYADTASANADSTLKTNLLESTRCWEGDASCNLYGRYYTWRAAMNLGWSDIDLTDVVWNVVDDTVRHEYVDVYDTVVVEDRCKTLKCGVFGVQENHFEDGVGPVEYCYVKTMSGECEYIETAENLCEYCQIVYGNSHLDISRFVPEAKPVIYQGVCPDGWRLPNKEDWEILQDNMQAQGSTLRDADGSGFGFTDMMTLGYDAENHSLSIKNRVYNRSVRFVAVPERVNGSYTNFFNWLFYEKYLHDAEYAASSSNDEDLPWDYTRYQEYGDVGTGFFFEEAPVRCIKN